MSVNIVETKSYYEQLDESLLCDCEYCKLYRSSIKDSYPEVNEYLASLGVDIEKPYETSPLEAKEDYLEYCCCQYVVFGSCSSNFYHKIGNIEFRLATSYPSTGIKERHFVLEFYPIILKIV